MATNILEAAKKAGFGKTLAVTAAFSLPAAAVIGIGWVMYRSGLAVRKRLSRIGEAETADIMSRLEADAAATQRRRERDGRRHELELEEVAERLQKAHREFEVR